MRRSPPSRRESTGTRPYRARTSSVAAPLAEAVGRVLVLTGWDAP